MVGSFTVKGSVFLGGIKARGMQRETVWLSVTSGQLLISDTTTHRKLRQEKGQTNLALVSKVWVASLSTATFTPLKFLTWLLMWSKIIISSCASVYIAILQVIYTSNAHRFSKDRGLSLQNISSEAHLLTTGSAWAHWACSTRTIREVPSCCRIDQKTQWTTQIQRPMTQTQQEGTRRVVPETDWSSSLAENHIPPFPPYP